MLVGLGSGRLPPPQFRVTFFDHPLVAEDRRGQPSLHLGVGLHSLIDFADFIIHLVEGQGGFCDELFRRVVRSLSLVEVSQSLFVGSRLFADALNRLQVLHS